MSSATVRYNRRASVTGNGRGKAISNRRGAVVGDFTVMVSQGGSGAIPSNVVLYNDGSPVLYNDGSFLLYN